MAAAVLRDVSDTALVTAAVRARETERHPPLFRDPYAGMLAGERGRKMARRLRCRLTFHGVTARTAALDELIMQTVTRSGARCVLSLGAGLDTRPYRLALPDDVRWVEVDLPGIIDYKEERLARERPRCQLERLGVDLTDPAARRTVLEEFPASQPSLVLCEGLLTYLDQNDVAGLSRDLARHPAFQWW